MASVMCSSVSPSQYSILRHNSYKSVIPRPLSSTSFPRFSPNPNLQLNTHTKLLPKLTIAPSPPTAPITIDSYTSKKQQKQNTKNSSNPAVLVIALKLIEEAVRVACTKIKGIVCSVPVPSELRSNLMCSCNSVGLLGGLSLFATAAGKATRDPLIYNVILIPQVIDTYCIILALRLLLGLIPNFPWDREPISCFREVCDPYFDLFSNFIPRIPIFGSGGKLNLNPLQAIAVMSSFGEALSGP